MSRYTEGQDRQYAVLLPERLNDFIAEDNQVCIVGALVSELIGWTQPLFLLNPTRDAFCRALG